MTDKATPLREPRWALWDYESEKWDEVPPANAPGAWLGGHTYGQPAPSEGLGTLNALQVCAEALALAESELEKLRTQPAPSEGLREAAQRMLDHHDALVSVPSGEPLNCDEAMTLRASLAEQPSDRQTAPSDGLRRNVDGSPCWCTRELGHTAECAERHAAWRSRQLRPPSEGLDVERLAEAIVQSMAPAGQGYIDIDRQTERAEVNDLAASIAREYAALDTPRETSE